MTGIERLQRMIDDLRRPRNEGELKSNQNPSLPSVLERGLQSP